LTIPLEVMHEKDFDDILTLELQYEDEILPRAETIAEVITDVQKLGFHVRRDKLPSIAYSEELISFAMSTSLQSTDRHHGIVGQEHCHFQRDS